MTGAESQQLADHYRLDALRAFIEEEESDALAKGLRSKTSIICFNCFAIACLLYRIPPLLLFDFLFFFLVFRKVSPLGREDIS